MQFQLTDLIRIIGDKYGLTFTDEISNNLAKLNPDDLPVGFLNEVQDIVLPLLEKQQNTDVNLSSKKELTEIVPYEYLEQINPIDDDGSKVFSEFELKTAVKNKKYNFINTNEAANDYRKILKASYIHDEYPIMSALESAWRVLENNYEVIKREEHPSDNPILSIEYYLGLGFYPPPELMMILSDSLSLYFNCAGKLSLDEILFGKKHKKTSSFSYNKHQKFKYQFFEMHLNRINKKDGFSNLSLETRMLKIIEETPSEVLASFGFHPNVDIDTFLRGYRRWKQNMKKGKYD